MTNIQFNYLYRDAANYKNFGYVIFENDNRIGIDDLKSLIISKLVDGEFFYAPQWNLPDLHFEEYHQDTDHALHEFESIEHTEEAPNSSFKLSKFIVLITMAN